MTLNVYNWLITPRIEDSKIALRQGVITSKNEDEAKLYLMSTFGSDELDLLNSKKNILLILPMNI